MRPQSRSRAADGLLIGSAAALAALCTASALHAETLHVANTGKPGASGTPAAPMSSIQEALDKAGAGDVVLLEAGVYRERVQFKTGGTFAKPVVLQGKPGAVIDGSTPVKLEWKPAPDVAPGVYRAPVPFLTFTVVADGKIVTTLREDRVRPGSTKGGPAWEWPNLFRNGVGPSGWSGVKALALYLPKEQELLIRFGDKRDPRKMRVPITVAPKEPVVQIAGTDRCVVRGITLRNAAYGVLIEDSLGSVVEDCTIGPADYGVWLDKGSDRCTVRFNDISLDPFSGSNPREKGAWDNWQANKTGGFYDRYGVQIKATRGGHEIHDNLIHDHWDGIEDRGAPGENVGLRIHHNRLVNLLDDGLEPNGAEEDCQWHDNLVERSICGLRIKAPTVGPLYAYRNIFFDNSEDFRNYGEVELKPASVFIYHNTTTAASAICSNKVFGIGTPNYHYFNNLSHCTYWWRNDGKSLPPNWKGDYNLYARRGDDVRWEAGRQLAAQSGHDSNSVWMTGDPGFRSVGTKDVSLAEASAARGKGVDLSRRLGRPLPGCAPGYFTGDAPDIGAVPFGRPMPRLPRKRDEVPGLLPAGFWPKTQNRQEQGEKQQG